jgi:hypothetical protein
MTPSEIDVCGIKSSSFDPAFSKQTVGHCLLVSLVYLASKQFGWIA